MIELRWFHWEGGKRLQYRFMMTINPNVSVWSEWQEVKDVIG